MTDIHEVDEEENTARCHCSGNNAWAAQVYGGLAQEKKPNATVTN
jgi:hypothetical protein